MTDNFIPITLPHPSAFERIVGGKQTHLYLLKNKSGMQAAVTDYGAHLVSILVPGKAGALTSVALGFDNMEGLLAQSNYYGATVGRFANRIAKGRFTLEGKEYRLPINNGPNTLHGGKETFSHAIWQAKQLNEQQVELTYLSKDMEEGFPGNLLVKVTYNLTDDNAVSIEYEATTDKTTIINLTNHTYFNLNGEGTGDILGHTVQIAADNYTPVDETMIPTGVVEPVKATPFDFNQPAVISQRITTDNEQLKFADGFDHNYVLNGHDIHTPVARVTGDISGIAMEVYTTEPGMQFYTGNSMLGVNTLRGGKKDNRRTGFAMETQHFPDSPNKPQFPSTLLKPGQIYKTRTIYKFLA